LIEEVYKDWNLDTEEGMNFNENSYNNDNIDTYNSTERVIDSKNAKIELKEVILST